MKYFLTALLAVSMALPTQAQLSINGVTLPASIKAGSVNVNLNGGGIRKKVFFKLYVGGLYLSDKSSDASAIVNADKPMAVKLQITSGMISSENMSEAILEGFENSTGGKTEPLKAKITEFVNTFKKEEIVEGNVFDIVYVPGKGVESYKNGKLQGTVEGLDFKKALFGIWLGAKPADEDLKTAMLGK
ncbi:MAG: chalcone isomerase family protein [Flavobacteriales bacterium]|nr:chalcone isomerase family protein [Flavobacteriales bacterium]